MRRENRKEKFLYRRKGNPFEGFEKWSPRVIRTTPQVFPGIMQMISSLRGMFRLIGDLQT